MDLLQRLKRMYTMSSGEEKRQIGEAIRHKEKTMVKSKKRKVYEYHATPTQRKRRSSRNKARRIMGLKNGDPREVDHKDNNPMNNSKSNLRAVSRSFNRKRKKKKTKK